MKQTEIDNLIKIKNENDILKLYPNAKVVQQKIAQVFYNIKPNVWINCFYMTKEGTCCSNYKSGDVKYIDYKSITLESIYSGSESKEDYKYIWSYSKI